MTIRIPIESLSLTNAPIAMLDNGIIGITVPFGDGHIEVESLKFNKDRTVTIKGEYFEVSGF